MGKFSRTFSMMRASWEVLKQDKELLVFPLLSAVGCVLVLASFAGPMLAMTDWQAASESVTASTVEALNASDGEVSADQIVQMLGLFAFYCCNYFVIIFFNAGLIACARIRMDGGDPTVGDGLRAGPARHTDRDALAGDGDLGRQDVAKFALLVDVPLKRLAAVRRHRMRLVGPNCMGLMNTGPEVSMNATFAPTMPPSSSISI